MEMENGDEGIKGSEREGRTGKEEKGRGREKK